MRRDDFFAEAATDLPGPLAGVRVLEATTAWAGPMVGCVLADLGADVVRVDLPGSPGGTSWPPNIPGTDLPLAHQTVNRNKRSIAVDLRRPEGRDTFLALVPHVDVVVQNFKAGTFDAWGVGYDDCRAVRPDIVYVSVSGYGQYGPWSDLPGYDPAALAASGWMSLNGARDGAPTKAPTFLADDLAGLHATIGTLAALNHRSRTGEGQHVDVALLDAIMFQSNAHLSAGALGIPASRWGNEVGVSTPTNSYPTRDGDVYVAIILDSHWRKLCELMGRPDLAEADGFRTNVERLDRRDEVNQIVGAYCATRTVDEVLADLGAAGIVCSRVNSYTEAARLDHVRERAMLQDVTLSDGSTAPIIGPVAKFSRTPTKVRNGAPVLGADTDDVLAAAGVDPARIAELRELGVI